MTNKELAALKPNKVRRDKNLMPLYISAYKEAFSVAPRTCCGGFKPDFLKWQKHVLSPSQKRNSLTLKTKTMAQGEFILKRKFLHKILTYRKDGRPHRVYGKLATQTFFEEYLTYGNQEELASRRTQFESIPKNWKPSQKPWQDTSITKTSQDELDLEKAIEDGTLNLQQAKELTVAQLKEYAASQKVELPAKRLLKADLIAHILEATATKEPITKNTDGSEQEEE